MRTAILLLLVAAAWAAQPSRQGGSKPHPKVEDGVECAACHDPVAKAWDSGRHGPAQVKCVACHGSPGLKFTARPAATTCRSCHPTQFESTAKACVSCHPAHALDPHAGHGKGGH